MIAADTNLLVYAHRRDNHIHAAAKRAITGLAEGKGAWGIPWPCLYEFYSIVTHPRIYAPPSTPARAIAQMEAWLAAPTLQLLAENEMHWPELRDLLGKANVQGTLVHDVRIAALCLAHGVREL